MSAVKPPLRGPRSISSAGWGLRTYTAFGIAGFANTLLPFIIFSGLYLIIPFPKPVVILIELLPALAAKLLFPHALHYIPHRLWLVLLLSCWTLATIATNAAPPNVIAPIRILIAILASASAAAAEVFFLSHLSQYGKTALAGWGAGTAAGGALRVVLPTLLTIHMGIVLRGSIGYAFYLLLAMAAAYLLVLPSPLCHKPEILATEDELESVIEGQNSSLLPAETSSLAIGFWERIHRNMQLTSSKLLRLCINPLLLITSVQVLVSSGTSRAGSMLSVFSRYSAFSTTYGLAFQLGNLIARSTALLFRTRRPRLTFALMVFCSIAAMLNTALILSSNAYFVFGIIFAIGWLSGMMYMNIFVVVMDYLSRNPEVDAEFALGSIGIGETAGILIGSLAGVAFESQLCGLVNRGGRWCSTIT
ncbi:Batten's disease protein Cln3 [Trichoderma ceciliae]